MGEKLLNVQTGQLNMPINPAEVKWDDAPIDRSKIKWNDNKSVSAMEDVAKGFGIGIPKGAAALVGLPGTIGEMSVARQKKEPPRKILGTDLNMPPRLMDLAERGVNAAFNALPSASDIQGGIEKVTGPWYKPQTTSGRIAEFTGSLVPSMGRSALTTRGLLQTGSMGLGGGIAGEAASAVTDNEFLQGGARILGTGFGAVPFMLRGTPASTANEALRNVSEAQLKQAQKLMDDAARMGSPITGAEAIAQVTGKNSLQDVQRVVEASQKGGPVMQPMMNARPQANESMFQAQANRIGPMPQLPAQTPVALQSAAESAITQARQAGNAAAKPFYDAAEQFSVSPNAFNQLIKDPAVAHAIKQVRNSPQWGVMTEPPNSVRVLDAAKKWIDDAMANVGPNEKRIFGAANDKIKIVADRATMPPNTGAGPNPSSYAMARSVVSDNMRRVVNPMQNSPVGNIANVPPTSAEQLISAQSNILMPQAPKALNPNTIKYTISTLNKQNPTAARDFVRQNLQSHFDEVTQKLVAGENQWGGAKFASVISGNKQQEQNLKALIDSVSGSKSAWPGFKKMLEVLEAQGKRQGPGSQTEFNKQISGQLSSGNLSPVTAPTRFIGEWYQNFRYGKNADVMAKILSDPKSVDKLKQIAISNPNNAKTQALVAEIIASHPLDGVASDQ